MYHSRNVFVLVATVLLLFVLTPNVVNSKSLRAMQQMLNTERHQTFVDVNGGYVLYMGVRGWGCGYGCVCTCMRVFTCLSVVVVKSTLSRPVELKRW